MNNKRGFTLLEVMISLVVIAVGLLGIAELSTSVIRGNSFSDKMTTALILAQDRLEELRNLNFNNPQLNGANWNVMNWDSNGDFMVDANDNDNDNDGISDFFDIDDDGDGVIANEVFDYINSGANIVIAPGNPIDINDNGNVVTVQIGGFWRVWNVWNNNALNADAENKTIVVMVGWTDDTGLHSVVVSTVRSNI